MIRALQASPLEILPIDVLGALADQPLRRFGDGEALMREGEVGDRAFVLVEGHALVVIDQAGSREKIAEVSAGCLVGELALLTEEPVRHATVVARGEVSALPISRQALHAVLEEHPKVDAMLRQSADDLLVARMLRGVGPLAGMSEGDYRNLAGRVSRRDVRAGELIIEQGAPSDACFVLRSGEARVEEATSSHPERSPILRPGALFGEVGLLADEPRSASVRALETAQVLVLSRADVMAVADRYQPFTERVVELLRLRERPSRVQGVEAHDRVGDGGEEFTILKDPVRGRYFRLSPLGRFAWDRLDGTRNVRDLALEYLEEEGRFAPQQITDVTAALASAGFLKTVEHSLAGPEAARPSPIARLSDQAWRTLTWHKDVHGVDAMLGASYRRLRFLFTRAGLVVLTCLGLAGVMAFVWPLVSGDAEPDAEHARLLWVLVPAIFLDFLVHELGHALAVKAIGRDVNRAGFGWFWVGPMIFVDVSDTWLATPRQRLAVALAGPAATGLMAGTAALIALGLDGGPAVAAWLVALSFYISILQNLNPLIELDGYYALSHGLNRPNLRPRALGWLREAGVSALWHPSSVRGHAWEAGYALASVCYLIASAVLVVLVYRTVLEGWVAGWSSDAVAAAMGWLAAALVVMVSSLGVLGDVRNRGVR